MTEIPKAYEPQSVEDKWYDFWVKQGCFTADPARVTDKRPAYSIVIPPPNVTGMLHMGHVLNNTIQDILSRKARMDGKEVLWLPGTDHAGIATEGMVAKQLKKEEHKTKQDIGREEFLKRVWVWKEKHGGIITSQLKKLGCSCDWTRERFTMDPDYARNVQRVFVDLYQKGLIYRGKRMVNWCPATQTALSDEEVEMKPQKGFMYHFKVQVAEAPDTWLTIATTRPETIPADTAVAVNPKDPRYKQLIGKHVYRALPLDMPKEQRIIPIIADDHVDFEFGTGVLKVTPAHDKADFDIGQRHKLPIIDVLTPDAKMTAAAGAELAGLDRFVARKKAAEMLEAAGALGKAEPYENNVGFSQRADVPIEPRLSEQWFLKYPSVEVSKACVADGNMKFHPDRWAKVYDHWLTNIQDWCISRQLWWGHRIPVWSKRIRLTEDNWPDELLHWGWDEWVDGNWQKLAGDDHALTLRVVRVSDGVEIDPKRTTLMPVTKQDEGDYVFYVYTVSPAWAKAFEDEGFTQDPDVLDTWFSSWLWPFATMGWTGDKARDANAATLRAFYPTTDLVTGPDIIFFWVARMIMAGYEYMGDLPFRNVYFTGIIRDKQGRKMSKTLGNSPDPLELIAKYGADALRFGTMRSAPLGQDVLFDEKDVELGRNFCNKLWNACRFRQMQGGEVQGEINAALLTSDDRWILLRLDQAIREVSDALASYNFATAVQSLYRFFWSEYCDWYVEASKAALRPVGGSKSEEFEGDEAPAASTLQPFATSTSLALRANKLAVIDFILSHTLRLFHPFLPFITEELWHGMGYQHDLPDDQGGRTIMTARWPKPLSVEEKEAWGLDDAADQIATAKYELVTQGRNLKTEFNIGAGKKGKFTLKPAGQLDPREAEVLRLLLSAESLELDPNFTPKKGTPTALTRLGELYLPLDGLVDVEAERARLTKELAKIQSEIEKVQQKLANPSFAQKVPAAVLEEHEQRLADWQAKLGQVESAIEALG
jgi:valyl-tRNA synthetase